MYFSINHIQICITVAILSLGGLNLSARNLTVHTNFEGGSAKIISVDQENHIITFRPGGNEKNGWPCWWYFLVKGIIPGTEITIIIENPPIGFWAKPNQATFSIDNRTWRHTPPGKAEGENMIYKQVIHSDRAWFAWGPPFLLKDALDITQNVIRGYDEAFFFKLATSLDGRPVPALNIAKEDKKPDSKPVVWIQARQHAWESGSSWVGRGFIEWLMSADEKAIWLRENARVIFVPVMDVDNVTSGNGGKNQEPHDHNRDWSDNPIFPAVRAAREMLRKFDEEGNLKLFIDLHNPGNNAQAFFMIPPLDMMDDITRENYELFGGICEKQIQGPITFKSKPSQMRSTYDKRWKEISNFWVMQNSQKGVVALTLETPWNTRSSTTDGYMAVGRQLGLGIAEYLQSK